MDADRPPVRVWRSWVLSRSRVFLPCSAVPARAVVTRTPELLVSFFVWLYWLQRVRQCSWTPAPPEVGIVISCLQGKREKCRCEQGFRDSQPCPVAVESCRDAVRRAPLPCSRKLVARSTPVPQLPPASAERHPVHRHGPSGADGHVRKGTEQPWRFPGTTACIKHSASSSLQELCRR